MKNLTRRKFIKQSSYATAALALPFPDISFLKYDPMTDKKTFDVIIVGGSYSGLSAGMALGRALRNVLIIDSGKPCNRQTPHSHNFITHDGKKPNEISALAKQQVEQYETVKFYNGLAVDGVQTAKGFEVTTDKKDTFEARKLIFATGLKDVMPSIEGFAECWGISVIHCPYCHGYEVRNQKTGILANGDEAFHYAQLISNWTKDLTIFTNGKSTLNQQQNAKVEEHHIRIIEQEISAIKHSNGYMQEIVFADGSTFPLKAIYARPNFEQHCAIPEKMGCELTEQGFLKVDMFQKTSVQGLFACGDNTSPLRAISYAVATGNIAGAVLNNEMIEAEF